MHELLDIKSLIALICADIDVFLLLDEDQEKDNDKEYFTREEIREQLKSTLIKTNKILQEIGYDINKPLLREFKLN